MSSACAMRAATIGGASRGAPTPRCPFASEKAGVGEEIVQIDQRGSARHDDAAHALDASVQTRRIEQTELLEVLDVHRDDVDEHGDPMRAEDLERRAQSTQLRMFGARACKGRGVSHAREHFSLPLG